MIRRAAVNVALAFALILQSPPGELWSAIRESGAAISHASPVASLLRSSLRALEPGSAPLDLEPLPPDIREQALLLLDQERLPAPYGDVTAARALSLEEAAQILRTVERVLSDFTADRLRDPQELEAASRRIWTALDLPVLRAASPPASFEYRFSPVRWTSVLLPRVPRADREVWQGRKEEILAQAGALRGALAGLAAKREAELGPEAFAEQVDASQVFVEVPELGKAELTAIDGSRVVRVTHAPTELSLIFLEDSAVRDDSRHLRQFVARQHIDAGRTRQDGQHGRDVVVLREAPGTPADRFLGRHRPTSRAWWADYWHATAKRPGPGDFAQGLFWAAVQWGLAYGLLFLQVWLGVFPKIDHVAPLFTWLFGVVVGTFGSAYLNWTYRGSQLSQMAKTSSISFLFAFTVIAFTYGPGALNPLSIAGWGMLSHIAINVFLNNLGKVAWQQLSKLIRENRGVHWRLPFGMKPGFFVHQILYTVNWTLRLMDLIGVPLGRWILIGSIPLARWFVLRYAEKRGFPQAREIREQWEREKSFLLHAPARVAGWLLKVLRKPQREVPPALLPRFPSLRDLVPIEVERRSPRPLE